MSSKRRRLDSPPSSTAANTADELENDDNNEDEDEAEVEEQVKEMAKKVKEMAKKVKEYRSTLPKHLNSTLSSLLASLRPPPPISLSSDVSHPLPGAGAESSSDRYLTAGDAEKTAEDIKLLKDKISSNISEMPKVLKRMNDCISRIDSLVSSDETIHPTFKKKKR